MSHSPPAKISGFTLRTAHSEALKTTSAAFDAQSSSIRFAYEPAHIQSYSFVASLVLALALAFFIGAGVGGVGMVLLYFLVYAVAAGVSVRKVEFSLSQQSVIVDPSLGAFGFPVRKDGKDYILGFKADRNLISSIIAQCRSYREERLVRRHFGLYPVLALICGPFIMLIGKLMA